MSKHPDKSETGWTWTIWISSWWRSPISYGHSQRFQLVHTAKFIYVRWIKIVKRSNLEVAFFLGNVGSSWRQIECMLVGNCCWPPLFLQEIQNNHFSLFTDTNVRHTYSALVFKVEVKKSKVLFCFKYFFLFLNFYLLKYGDRTEYCQYINNDWLLISQID